MNSSELVFCLCLSLQRHYHNTAKMFFTCWLLLRSGDVQKKESEQISRQAGDALFLRPGPLCCSRFPRNRISFAPVVATGESLCLLIQGVCVCVTNFREEASKNNNWREISPLLCKKQTGKILPVVIQWGRPYATHITRSYWPAVDKHRS